MSEGEVLARRFHQLYEAMAPGFGYETRTETREFDPESNNGKLMIAVCSVIQGMHTARLAEAEQAARWLYSMAEDRESLNARSRWPWLAQEETPNG